MNAFPIGITLREPLTVGFGATVGNEIRSLDFIPATMLRGALFEQLRLTGRSGEAEAWFGPRGPRWTPAFPSGCVPMPRCFLGKKRQNAFAGEGVWNGFSDTAAPGGFNAPLSARWLRVDQNLQPCGSFRARERIDMHASLHYETQSARRGALFSRETLESGMNFTAWVSAVPPHASEINEISLGKRHSVNGAADLTWPEASAGAPQDAWNCVAAADSQGSGDSFLYLASDCIIPGPSGGWLRGLDSESLTRLCGARVEVRDSFSSTGTVSGWNSRWNLPGEQFVTIRSGSCWRVRPLDPPDPKWFAWKHKIAADGLGIRGHEGFGWLMFDPPWLTATRNQIFPERNIREAAGSAAFTPEFRSWPGYESASPEQLDRLVTKAHQAVAHLKPADSSKIHDLLVRSQREGNPLDLIRQQAYEGIRTALEPGLGAPPPGETSQRCNTFFLAVVKILLEARR